MFKIIQKLEVKILCLYSLCIYIYISKIQAPSSDGWIWIICWTSLLKAKLHESKFSLCLLSIFGHSCIRLGTEVQTAVQINTVSSCLYYPVFFHGCFFFLCTLVQVLRLCTGRTAHGGSRGITLLFHDHGTRRGWGVSVTLRSIFTPGKVQVPIVQEAGWAPGPVWTGAENLAPTEIRSPDR